MLPIISVIMPAFNVDPYITETIDSVLKQTFQEFELIIINDGSTDGTEAVISAFQCKDPRIVYYKQNNRGVAASRNQGLLMARGESIAFLDADDLWDPYFLEKALIQKNKLTDCVFSENNWLLPSGRYIRYSERLSIEAVEGSGNVLLQFVQKRISIHICAILLKKEFLVNNGITFTDGCMMGEDTEFKCKTFAMASIGYIPEVLMTYRQRKGSLTQQEWNWHTYIHSVQAFERGFDYVKRNYQGENYAIIVSECQKGLNYRTYRFLYFMLRYGYFSDLLRLVQKDDWGIRLKRITIREYGIMHRLKSLLIVSKQVWLWGIYAVFGKMVIRRRRKELTG